MTLFKLWFVGHKSDVPPRVRIFLKDPQYAPKNGPSLVLWTDPKRSTVTVFRGGKGITGTLSEEQRQALTDQANVILAATALTGAPAPLEVELPL